MKLFLTLATALLFVIGVVSTGWSEDEASDEAAATQPSTTGENPAEENQDGDEEDFSTFRQIQPEVIHFTLVEFYRHEIVKQIQEQMYSIPGVTDFIPYLETPGLITYDLRYSGPSKLLMKALTDIFNERYELGMKEIGERAWEITMRKLIKPI